MPYIVTQYDSAYKAIGNNGMATVIRQSIQLGNWVRTRRKELGLTQAALAAKAGLRQATISQIETGSNATRIDTLLRVIAMLDMDLMAGPRQRTDIEDVL
jgi:HTH-type transcriptional regulator/antitoxin HipB